MTLCIRKFSSLRDFGNAADCAPLRRLSVLITLSIAALCLSLGLATTSALASSPAAWKVTVTPNADFVLPGSEYVASYKIEAENVGDAATSASEPIVVEDVPPAGTTIEQSQFDNLQLGEFDLSGFGMCPTANRCVYPEGPFKALVPQSLGSGKKLVMVVAVNVPSGVEGTLKDVARISGGGLPPVEASGVNTASAEPPFGTLHFDAAITNSGGEPYTQAGGHPYELTTEFNFETYSTARISGFSSSGTVPMRDPKDIAVDLPPGLIANPQSVPHCSLADYFSEECARSEVAIGDACIQFFGWTEGGCRIVSPILNLQPENAFPAEFGILIGGAPFILVTTQIRTGGDYGATAVNVAGESNVSRVKTTFWGVPADPGHDGLRGKECQHVSAEFKSVVELERQCEGEEGVGNGGGSAEVEETPYLTLPTECSGDPLQIGGRYDSWQVPGEYTKRAVDVSAVDGCNVLSFEPTIEAKPTTNLADAPSGLEFNLHIPQNEDPEGVATPELKEAVVRFPKGLSINPASGDGLGTCSEAQIGLHTEAPALCPDASKLGSVEVKTRLLRQPLDGGIYLATPYENPSHSFLGNYLIAEGQGLRLKLYGGLDLNPDTGQITARFRQNPQLPFEDLLLRYFGGTNGTIRSPALCGDYTTTSAMTPFSAPESGPPAPPTSSFETSAVAHGSVCPTNEAQEPHLPRFRAGTERPRAGEYSPFALRLVREDGSQELLRFEVTLPPGLTANLSGIPYCSEVALSAAEGKTGGAEKASPSCSASSEVGTVEVASGAGPTPLNVPGHVYLAGPYKGAPLSLAFVTPVVAGPFDLGTTVVRAAVYLDPKTIQNHVISDPLPTALNGIPLDIRSVTVKLDRPRFMLNPTKCEEFQFAGSAISVLGAVAPLSERFQVGDCAALRFKPRLRLSLSGAVHRNGHPRLRAVVTPTPGGAALSRTQVTLPPTEFVDNGHLRDVCTNIQFEANACPETSIYGRARAETPLLSEPLEGPVFLQPSAHRVPDLVAALSSGAFAINLHLHARQDSVRASIRTTFEDIPDVPLTRFVLNMAGGTKGLLVNSKDLCAKRQRLRVRMVGQNSKVYETQPLVKVPCGKTKGRHRSP